MSDAEFSEKYHRERAILSMDMTGFTAFACPAVQRLIHVD